MTKQKQDIKKYVIDQLTDLLGHYEGYGCDLINETLNTDYFIVGYYNAEQWLGDLVFDAIRIITEYENEMFGETFTDLSDSEKVVNMLAYILGEQLLNTSKHLTDDAWDREIDADDIKIILEEINHV